MEISWTSAAQPIATALAAMLGVYLTEDILRVVRRRNECPDRWKRARSFLLSRREAEEQ